MESSAAEVSPAGFILFKLPNLFTNLWSLELMLLIICKYFSSLTNNIGLFVLMPA